MGEILNLHNYAIVTPDMERSWQEISDVLAELFDAKAALVMKADLDEDEMEVLVKSSNADNPYPKGHKDPIKDSGFYCEYVLKNKKKLHVKNALREDIWKDNPDIELGLVSYLGYPIKKPDGSLFGTICILDSEEIHISEKQDLLLKKFRDHIELDLVAHEKSRAERRLITEKNLLMREANHRLKNNMSTIYGLLFLQAESTDHESAKEVLNDAARRVKSMSILHDKLSRNSFDDEVNVREYTELLVDDVIEFYEGIKTVKMHLDIDDFSLDSRTISALGIITNELVVNSMKHAFNENHKGEIKLAIKETDDVINLAYGDSGDGFKVSTHGSKTFGLQLIEQLSFQLGGELDFSGEDGYHTVINFPRNQ
ncbi:MAG: GAF domain-containing protein [Balneolia bacterium]|nr:GAF domain-containing protein [Balneolia bacterium]